ncbi:TlpA family protein disulfide reductase [Spongiivirga citrea]|uniref:Redoxin domain-containing protein n=1 Tax=Spongiivirga citrea TaxID=1481457 RepID=A0A6M0CR56_9FLAO|nr:TlpA disulfide reductase family protein [Spongiivirga citrea]NER18349.1 redoxin domain-containing protein [Spongiivirga citrea]
MKSFLYLLAFLPIVCSAQKTYYKMPDNQIFSKQVFDIFDKKFKNEGVFEMKIKERIVKKDSIINIVEILELKKGKAKLTSTSTKKSSFDPFTKHKEKIGEHFDISMFKKPNGSFYDKTDIAGKPTFINMWFIKCPPCIKEIPLFNEVKKAYGDQVNFLAITFDTQEKVKQFLKIKDFDFTHITDARTQLDEMQVNAYPMNIILDKDGVIQFVSGNVSAKRQITDLLDKLL